MIKPKVLFAKIEAPVYSSNGMESAFKDIGYDVIPFDWQKVRFHEGFDGMKDRLLGKAMMEQPSIIFLHLQTEEAIDVDLAKALQQIGFVINYTFDVRSKEQTQWMYDIAPHIGLTLFACKEDVDICVSNGINNVALVQSSFNQLWYGNISKTEGIGIIRDDSIGKRNGICFIGNDYSNTNLKFEKSEERKEMVSFLETEYDTEFKAYGLGQKNCFVNPQQEIEIYNNSKIAICHNNFDRELYTSDRIWKILACGTFCLTKYFKGIETIFERGRHLDWWSSFDELKEKIDIYLSNGASISQEGMNHVNKHHQWKHRFLEIQNIILSNHIKH